MKPRAIKSQLSLSSHGNYCCHEEKNMVKQLFDHLSLPAILLGAETMAWLCVYIFKKWKMFPHPAGKRRSFPP